jgi:hypothetical protein
MRKKKKDLKKGKEKKEWSDTRKRKRRSTRHSEK